MFCICDTKTLISHDILILWCNLEHNANVHDLTNGFHWAMHKGKLSSLQYFLRFFRLDLIGCTQRP